MKCAVDRAGRLSRADRLLGWQVAISAAFVSGSITGATLNLAALALVKIVRSHAGRSGDAAGAIAA